MIHHQHPALRKIKSDEGRSDRVATAAVNAMGSVRFIVVQTVIVAIWIGLNIAVLALRWDAYP